MTLLPTAILAPCRGWFSAPPKVLGPLSEGGFSGCPTWLLEAPGTDGRRFVLKAFAAGCSPERARFVHRLVDAARAGGVDEVPAPLPIPGPGPGADTIFRDGSGRLWEMVEWRPGVPVSTPNPRQARDALALLARLHVAVACVPFTDGHDPETLTDATRHPPPAWERRRRALLSVASHGFKDAARPGGGASALEKEVALLRTRAATILARRGGVGLIARLAAVTVPAVQIQPVLRDVWHAHILFSGDRPTGLIDFHAAGTDTPAADLARLLGSWLPSGEGNSAAQPTVRWREALEGYEAVRPLSGPERGLVDLLHAAGTVGALQNWFAWVLDEGREFPSAEAAAGRVRFLVENLDSALEQAESLLGGAGLTA